MRDCRNCGNLKADNYPCTERCCYEWSMWMPKVVKDTKPKEIDWKAITLSLDRDGKYHKHNLEKVSDLGVCTICKRCFDWWCEESPNHQCDYTQEDGSFDFDSCRYCGGPDERK